MSFETVDSEHAKRIAATAALIGRVYPVILDQNGKVMSGKHRLKADPKWPTETRTFNTEWDREVFILGSNVQRQQPPEQVKYHLLRLAKILEAEGTEKDHVCGELSKRLEGIYTERYVRELLPDEYKQASMKRENAELVPQIETAIQQSEADAEQVTHALDALAPSSEKKFPFTDCRCPGCPRENKCY